MESSIDVLPREVMQIIFSNLSVPERLNASLVCKKWLDALNCKSLLRDITVVINNNLIVPTFTFMSRNFLNFCFNFIIVDNKYYHLFKRFSAYVEYLSFEKCEVWKREPVNFDDLKYDNLRVLRITDCELWTLFPCLPNLMELYLSGNSTITDDGFAILQKTMKRLKVLSLLCPVSCERKVLRRFYPKEKTYETNPSSCILSLHALKSFLAERACSLKEIYLNSGITSTAIKELSAIKDLCLYKIDISGGIYYAEGLIYLFKNQQTLKIINLHHVNINDNIIGALYSFLPEVEEVSLRCCAISNNSLNYLFQLTKLSKLDIGEGQLIKADVFNEAILNFKAFQIKSLNLSHRLREPTWTALDVLFRQCNNLVSLDICCNKISDTVVHIISETLVHLEYLCLKRCDITDCGLMGCDKENIVLPTDMDCNNQKSLSNLKNLKVLKLNDCNKITDNAMIYTIKFQYLEFLYVNGCNLELDTLRILLLQNPRIKKIYWHENDLENPRIGEMKKRKKYFGNFIEDELNINDLISPDRSARFIPDALYHYFYY